MRTYILGDIHGEYDSCIEILKSVGLISENLNWGKGVKDTLIQVGDVIDRGDKPIESYMLLKELQKEAVNEGGKVIRLLGNHELNYIGGPVIQWEELGSYLADDIRKEIIDGKIAAACSIDDWIVVHAGVMPHISSNKSLKELVDELNLKLINAVKYNNYSDEIFFAGYSRGGYQEPGIFWADYDVDLLPIESKLIKQIVGHTPPLYRKPTIEKSEDGKIINVDIGICTMYGGNKGILLYENNGFNSIIL